MSVKESYPTIYNLSTSNPGGLSCGWKVNAIIDVNGGFKQFVIIEDSVMQQRIR